MPWLKAFVSRVVRIFGYRLVDTRSGLPSAEDPLATVIYELCARADEGGIETLPARHRTVVHAWAAHGIISNGGFKYYYEGDWMMADVAAAYRTLGFEAAARACDASLEIFPARVPPQDEERRAAIVEQADFTTFANADEIFRVTFDALKTAIGEYMDRHPQDFAELLRAARGHHTRAT